jgi:F0F1-type ATP synthase membrane subunit b/b'
MNNYQLLISAGMPTLAVLIGILVNQAQVTALDKRIGRIEDRLETIQRDMREFYAVQRQHDTRIEKLERQRGSR